MKLTGTILAATLILSVAVVAAFAIAGPARIWGLFGPADLGPVAFEQLERRATPNDALACPADLCKALSDMPSPRFAVDARALRAAMENVLATESNVTRVAADEATRTERFVQRSAWLGFPDTIVVRYLELPGDRSTLAVYSRSQLGRSDLGANRARIARWLTKLAQQAPVAE